MPVIAKRTGPSRSPPKSVVRGPRLAPVPSNRLATTTPPAERQARLAAGKPIQRIRRKIDLFYLGATRDDILRFLPTGHAALKSDIHDGLTVTFPVEVFNSMLFDFEPTILAISSIVTVLSLTLVWFAQWAVGLDKFVQVGGSD